MARTVVAAFVAVAAGASTAAAQARRPTIEATTQSAGHVSNLDNMVTLSERWQDVPQSKRLRLSVQIVDEVTELGNLIGTAANDLSDDMLGLKFDGRRRRAKLRVGTGEGYLRFRLESDWHFTQGKARIAAKLQLGIGVGSSRVDLQACKLEYSIVSPK